MHCPNFLETGEMERTLIIFKPDAMEKGIVGQVLDRLERARLSIVGMRMLRMDEAILREHYAHLADRSFFPEIVVYMSSRPVLVAILEGKDAVARVREMAGPTDSRLAPRGTIRGDFGKDKTENVLHASDSGESAEAEIARFFAEGEVFNLSTDGSRGEESA
jgi:nucleoside-diphosphate kinase